MDAYEDGRNNWPTRHSFRSQSEAETYHSWFQAGLADHSIGLSGHRRKAFKRANSKSRRSGLKLILGVFLLVLLDQLLFQGRLEKALINLVP